jgi:hypothetical protein
VFYIGVLVFSAWHIYLHTLAGLTLPVPWGDEALFVWQARAFERTYSFIAPQIDATRPILHQPFTYPAILAFAFTIFGNGLEVARGVSLVFTLGAFALLAAIVMRRSIPLISIVLIGLFINSASVVAMANVARMEAVLFFIVCLAMLLLQKREVWLCVAVLSLAPMIHPNGIFFLGAAAAYGIAVHKIHTTRPPKLAVAVLAVAAILWLANGVYALSYWDAFVYDLAHRVGESMTKNEGVAQQAWLLLGLAVIGGIGVIGQRQRQELGVLLVFALGAWLASQIRHEQWYAPVRHFAYLLIALAVLELVAKALRSLNWTMWKQKAGFAVVALAVLALQVRAGFIEGPRNYFADFNSFGMHLAKDPPYFTESDLVAVRDYVRSMSRGDSILVEVHQWADSLLLRDIEKAGARIQLTYLDALYHGPDRWAWGYKATQYPTPDLYVFHVSRYHPQNIADRLKRVMDHALKTAGVDAPMVISSRNGTEIWYAISTQRPDASKR